MERFCVAIAITFLTSIVTKQLVWHDAWEISGRCVTDIACGRTYELVIGFPEDGADVGEYENFMKTLQKISALVVGEIDF